MFDGHAHRQCKLSHSFGFISTTFSYFYLFLMGLCSIDLTFISSSVIVTLVFPNDLLTIFFYFAQGMTNILYFASKISIWLPQSLFILLYYRLSLFTLTLFYYLWPKWVNEYKFLWQSPLDPLWVAHPPRCSFQV